MTHDEIKMVEPGYLFEFVTCPRCNGKGYHHGFGERGWDPDWCERCDGSQFESRELLTPYET